MFSHPSSVLDQTWVSLDLETTGLDSNRDEIIEVGAVKFQGQDVLDTYQTLVNPYKQLSEFVKDYTSITQRDVDRAPPFAVVAGELASFVGSHPLLGHNVAFDLGFLEKKGLRLANPRSDTWDLAFVLLPETPDYSLSLLAEALGISHPQPHRALPDASVTQKVFLKLIEKALELDLSTLAEIQRLAARSQWVLAYIAEGLQEQKAGVSGHLASKGGLMGFDEGALKKRLQSPQPLHPRKETVPLDPEVLVRMMADGGPVSRAIPGYEARQEQVEMMKAVAESINARRHLIVEGGTGIGKSLAYLLPAVLHALNNHRRVVVSTNTINLQEQLINKDVPSVCRALNEDGVPIDDFYATQLKGRANYLCLRRWTHLRANDSLSSDEARILAKTLVWLQKTTSGDRAELNLAGRTGLNWDRISAQGAPECPAHDGPCFLKSARDRAAGAHLVVVNHALLLSDMAMGGTLIPSYDTLIVDEAHHLEEEATQHLGSHLSQTHLEDHLQALSGQDWLLQRSQDAFRGSTVAAVRRESVEAVVNGLTQQLPRARDTIARFYQTLTRFIQDHRKESQEGEFEFRVTRGLRNQPGWTQVEVEWENVNLSLGELGRGLQNLHSALEGLEDANLVNYQALMTDLSQQIQTNSELRSQLSEFIPHPSDERIYWLSQERRDGTLTMHGVPLQVGDILQEQLFSQKGCVVLTSATLSAKGSFRHIRQRVGLSEGEELLLGSPFDYKKAALLCAPEDMPEPSSWAYQAALEQAIVDAVRAAKGRTMVLFTSHSSLQATRYAVRNALEADGIQVLAQRIDGAPRRLQKIFLDNPKSLLLGTSSFWEGVDLAGDALKVLVLVRLPFNVPTDPVFQARSELFEDPFNEYAVPHAIIRFRQGFGRLIRTREDKGVVVVLDRRLTSRPYGNAFLSSLPDCTIKRCSLRELGQEIGSWVGA